MRPQKSIFRFSLGDDLHAEAEAADKGVGFGHFLAFVHGFDAMIQKLACFFWKKIVELVKILGDGMIKVTELFLSVAINTKLIGGGELSVPKGS